jgi:hypothetical protein
MRQRSDRGRYDIRCEELLIYLCERCTMEMYGRIGG